MSGITKLACHVQGWTFHWTVSTGFGLADATNYFVKMAGYPSLQQCFDDYATFKKDNTNTNTLRKFYRRHNLVTGAPPVSEKKRKRQEKAAGLQAVIINAEVDTYESDS